MMHPTMPQSTREEQIFFPIFLPLQNLIQRTDNGQRIVQYPKRIDITPELIFFQQIPNILCEAGAKKQNLL